LGIFNSAIQRDHPEGSLQCYNSSSAWYSKNDLLITS